MRWHGGAAGLLVGLTAASALAADPPDRQACVAAYENAQTLRRALRLIEARAALITCSQQGCPAVAVADCVPWLAEVERGLPSVVVVARDASGADVPGVKVSVDGVPLRVPAPGAAVPVDPGEHRFRFESPAGARVEQRVVIREGEKNRALTVTFGAPSDPARAEGAPSAAGGSSRPVPPLSWALGGTSVAAFAVFAGFGIRSLLDESQLRSTCAPRCPADQVSAIRREHTAADVGLGVGVAALAAAAAVFFTRPTVPARAGASAFGLTFQLGRGGGSARFEGVF